MKIIVKNSSLIFAKALNKVTITASELSSGATEGYMINGRTGEDRVNDSYTLSSMQDIPSNVSNVSIYNTDYSLVDGYSTFGLYDKDGTWLVSGCDNMTINLEDYPTAKKFKLSWKNSNVYKAKVIFSE